MNCECCKKEKRNCSCVWSKDGDSDIIECIGHDKPWQETYCRAMKADGFGKYINLRDVTHEE